VPRVAVNVVLAPVRTVVWAEERYQLEDLYYRTFFNRDRTIGLYPTATYETDFGFTGGARFVARDVLGAHEQLSLEATTAAISGVHYRDDVHGSLSTGRRLGDHLSLELAFNLDPAELRAREAAA